ncbi:3-phosphoshikimate 1-carboxyvinyltransferase [Marininema halotolerans]|uniref:3-phosphoshikimate 1-carboxyvinyltransferase n=1 Tax=Marininema halotolerans TaxID=1155944 RepID=A0A1I6PRE5_9BACL|nr:3-phosphoshikimate 1-carboxyvinyltransferase [Marininema halotolerans]SFS42802.1 3-phosphoshikimate 1-carboxyvinyltransferase [Marininema halotolerans]
MNESHSTLESRSKWATLHSVSIAEISPPHHPIHSDLMIPGSKSVTNRALIMAAMAKGTSILKGILKSDDTYWCIEALKALGVTIEINGNTAIVHGVNGKWPHSDGTIYVGSAGTAARFLPGVLAASQGRWMIRGSQQMMSRPISPLINALNQIGAQIGYVEKEGHLPIEVIADGIRGGEVPISGRTSSQYISGLLMAGAYAKESMNIRIEDGLVQPDYVKITMDLMRIFGANVRDRCNFTEIQVDPTGYVGEEVQLDADASTAGYFLSLAAVTNGNIRINNLSYDSLQPDARFVDVLEKMGCEVERGSGFIQLQGTNQLRGGFEISMREMSDQTLTLAALAPFADGPISMVDVEHIRMHECDRIKAICESLSKMGIRVEERQDGLTIYPGDPRPAELDTYDDHRLAMSLTLIGAKVAGVRLKDPGCVSKTCPSFFAEMERLGLTIRMEGN